MMDMSGLLRFSQEGGLSMGCPFMEVYTNTCIEKEYYWCEKKQEWIVDGEEEHEYFMKYCYGSYGYRNCPLFLSQGLDGGDVDTG